MHARGSHLHHLLVPDLHAAVPLEEVHRAARAVGHDLHLDVPGILQKFLEEDGAVAKCRAGLARATLIGVCKFGLGLHETHPAASAAEGCLEDDGQGDVVGRAVCFGLCGRVHEGRAAQNRHATPLGQLSGTNLIPKEGDGLGLRADKADPVFLARGRKRLAFAEETIAGVHCVRPCLLGCGDDAGHIEVWCDRPRLLGPDLDGLIHAPHVQRPCVLLREDTHGLEAHLLASAGHAHSDLPAVRDQHLGVRQRSRRSALQP
mmetsp:Transcript_61313/g.159247  ORF Transcript_61313/g.159247 Transcript_61313/m.159247 type:complete len:261 (+) Transcript_61313:2565-3347(+)